MIGQLQHLHSNAQNLMYFAFICHYLCYAGCTLSPREPETTRKQECRWKHLPRLRCSHVALGTRVSPRQFYLFQRSVISESKGLVSHPKIKYTLGHILVFIFDSLTNAHALFLLSYVHPHLALAPHGLRAHSKSIESCTRTISSSVTLARESRRMHLARVYSWHQTILK